MGPAEVLRIRVGVLLVIEIHPDQKVASQPHKSDDKMIVRVLDNAFFMEPKHEVLERDWNQAQQ